MILCAGGCELRNVPERVEQGHLKQITSQLSLRLHGITLGLFFFLFPYKPKTFSVTKFIRNIFFTKARNNEEVTKCVFTIKLLTEVQNDSDSDAH